MINCEAEYARPTPAANNLAMEVYDACFRNVPKDINVPLMRIGDQFTNGTTLTTLNSDSQIVQLYMKARDSMGKVILSGGGGSGFFVDADGRFATDYHVIKNNPNAISVRTGDGKLRPARLIDLEPGQDTAILQVQKLHPNERFKPLELSTLGNPKKDEYMMACGFARYDDLHCSPGRFNSFTRQKDIKLDPPAPYMHPDRKLGKLIQHTEQGDSGGPIFSFSDGKVRMLVDMTQGFTHTVGTPSERMTELMTRKIPIPKPNPLRARQGS